MEEGDGARMGHSHTARMAAVPTATENKAWEEHIRLLTKWKTELDSRDGFRRWSHYT
jgi:hypothetical protein